LLSLHPIVAERLNPVCFSVFLQGISGHAEELLKNLSYIGDAQSKGLVVFSWGDDNNEHEIRRKLREQGIDGIIYDRSVHNAAFRAR